MSDFVFVASRLVEPRPGWFVGPIANVFGYVIDFLFNLVYSIGPAHSLGITIIIMTIIFRALMMPMTIKAQKSMMKMREIKPELDKIQAKYGKTKDPEKLRKMNQERSALMAKHDANPIKGCFPLLLQMPLFIGLNFIMRQAFLYIGRLRDLYYQISETIISYPNHLNVLIPERTAGVQAAFDARELIPPAMMENAAVAENLVVNHGMSLEQAREQAGDFIHFSSPEDLSRVIHRFTPENWEWLSTQIPASYWNVIANLNEHRNAIETFFGLSMIESSFIDTSSVANFFGSIFRWPSILIPILVGVTMLMSSWLMQLRTNDPNADERVKLQMKMMLIFMPIMMAAITFGLPAGVGLFWITSQVFQIVQDLILNKRAGIPLVLPFAKKEE